MSDTTADFMIERMHQWGIRRIYGFPGDGINGIMGALERAEDRTTRWSSCRPATRSLPPSWRAPTRSSRVKSASASPRPVPGAIHLLNGLYDAKMDHQPVVAIVGQQDSKALGGDYQQEVDLISLFKDVARNYVHMCSHPAQMRHLVDRAIRIAKAERCVTCIIVPNDVQEMEAVKEPPRTHGTVHSGVGYSEPYIVPKDEDLKRAAAALNESKKVAMLVGAGALGASAEVKEVAELLGAGVAKALLGKAVLDDDLPYCTGGIGLLGTKPSWDMMMDCDALLMIGSGFPYSEFLPKEGQARGVQIDIDGRMLGLRYPMEVNLVGDAKETLRKLIPLLDRKTDRSWREEIEEGVRRWWKVLEDRAMDDADPINPQRVAWELTSKLPPNAILASDSGSSANWWARDMKVKESMMATLSGNLATMGPGVPYVIAAKFAWPDRPAIALVGDGAMQMNGINGLITIAKYWKQWRDPRLVIGILSNQDLNQVTWEQRVLAGDPEYPTTQDVPKFDFAKYAEGLGLKGIHVEEPDRIADAWSDAIRADRPCVIDFVTDPDVPPLPPHIKFQQAKHFLTSMLKGDPHAGGVIKQSVKQMVDTVMPHGS